MGKMIKEPMMEKKKWGSLQTKSYIKIINQSLFVTTCYKYFKKQMSGSHESGAVGVRWRWDGTWWQESGEAAKSTGIS